MKGHDLLRFLGRPSAVRLGPPASRRCRGRLAKVSRCTRTRSIWSPSISAPPSLESLNEGAQAERSSRHHSGGHVPLLPADVQRTPGQALRRRLEPQCLTNVKVYTPHPLSEQDRIGIGTFQPKDEKNQDSTELTGDINYRKIAEYGTDSDPRASTSTANSTSPIAGWSSSSKSSSSTWRSSTICWRLARA